MAESVKELELEVLLEYHNSLRELFQERIVPVIKQFYQGEVITRTTRDKLIKEGESNPGNGADNLLKEVEAATSKDASTFFKAISIMRSASVLYSCVDLGCRVTEIEKTYWRRQEKIKARRKSTQLSSSSNLQLSPNSTATTQQSPIKLESSPKHKKTLNDSPQHFKALACLVETEQEMQREQGQTTTTTQSLAELPNLDAPVQERTHGLRPAQETSQLGESSAHDVLLASHTSDLGASIETSTDEELQQLQNLKESVAKIFTDVTNIEHKVKEKQQFQEQLSGMKEFYEEQYKRSREEHCLLQNDLEMTGLAHTKELEHLEQKHKEEMEEKNEITSMEHSRDQAKQLQQTQKELGDLQQKLSEKEKECKSLEEKLKDMERQRDEIKGEIRGKKERLGIMTLKRNLQKSRDWRDKLGMCQEIQNLAQQICDGLAQEQLTELSRQIEEKIKLLQKRRTSQSWPRNKHN